MKRITHILETEIVTAMRLMGASSIKDLTPELVSHCFLPHCDYLTHVTLQVERVDWQVDLKARL